MPNQTQQVETILKLNVDYQQGIKDVGAYLAEIKKLKDEQSALNKALKDNQITEQQYGDAMAKNKTITAQLNGEMKVLTTELKKKLEADRADAKQIDINTASYNKLSQTYSQMKKRINEMDAAERQRNKAYIDQSKAVYERMKTLQAETGKMQLNVGNYQAAITQAITGNSRFAASLMGMTGGATNMGEAMGFANQNVMALGQTMKLLLTNPVFVAIAGIAGAGMAYSWFKDYNEGLAEATRMTKRFTDLAGAELGSVRDEVQAIADTYGKNFKEVMEGADVIVDHFGVTWKTALDTIQKGFAAGADLNGDMLSKIEQYGPVLRDAGLSAQEMVAVLQQTRTGVFGKDGLDIIARAGKSLRAMTKSTSEALQGVGIDAAKMRKELADGSITMFQAVQQVAKAMKEMGTNTQEAGQLINNVFGKKAVTAGQEQVKAIADLNMELDDLIKKEGEYGEVQQQIVETQTLINEYTAALFGMNGWDVMKKKSELFGKTLLLVVLRNIVNIINKTIDWYNFSEKAFRVIAMTVVASMQTAWLAVRTMLKLFGDGLSSLGHSLSGFGEIIEGVFTFKPEKIKAGWSVVTSSLRGAWQSAVVAAKGFGAAAAENFTNGWNAALNSEGIGHISVGDYTDAGGGSITEPGTRGTGNLDSGNDKKGKKDNSAEKAAREAEKAEKERQRLLEKQRREEEAAAKAELALRQKLIQSRLVIIKKGSQEEMLLRIQALEQERQLAIDRINQEYKDAKDQEMVQELILNTNKEYTNKRKALFDEFEKSERDRMAQASANMFTERIMAAADNELEQQRIKLEQAQMLRDNARQLEGETIEAWNARRLELEQNYLDQKQALADKEMQVEQAKLDAYASIAGGIGKVFEAMGDSNEDFAKLSKVLALAEIAINTGKAIAAGVAQAQSVPFPGNIAAIATTVATILANIATAISTVKSAKFAKGGLIEGIGTGTSDSITAKVSNGESVMTANATAMFSPLLSAINQLGGGVPIAHGGAATQMGEDMLAAAIAKGYAMAPAPVVSVREITDVTNQVQVIEDLARS